MTTTVDDSATAVAVASLHAMSAGTLADLTVLYTADCINREARTSRPRLVVWGQPPCSPPHNGSAALSPT